MPNFEQLYIEALIEALKKKSKNTNQCDHFFHMNIL